MVDLRHEPEGGYQRFNRSFVTGRLQKLERHTSGLRLKHALSRLIEHLAKELRIVVRERIDAGDSDQQAIDYIAARYGDYVLLEPPVKPKTYLLWVAPILLFAVAALAAVRYARGRRRPDGLSEDERAEARRILEEEAP